VPGTAGVLGDVGTVDRVPGVAGAVDGVIGVAGGVVVAPGPVPGIHGGWITPGTALFAGVVGAGEIADDPGGCVDVVVDCGLIGAGVALGTGAFAGCPGVGLPLGSGTPGCCALVVAGVVVRPAAGVVVRTVAGVVLFGVAGVVYGPLLVATGTHGTVTPGGGLGGGICPGMFAGRPVGVGCAGVVAAGGVDDGCAGGAVGVWLCAATRTVEHAAVTIRRLMVAVAVAVYLITSSP